MSPRPAQKMGGSPWAFLWIAFSPNSVLRSAVNIVVCMSLTLNACVKDELWLWFDAFELWWWRRHLRVPWTARRSNQWILKEISPEHSLEGLMLNFHYFGHLMWKSDSLEKTLMLGKVEGRRRRGWQRMRWLDGITDSTDMKQQTLGDSGRQKSLACCSSLDHKELDLTEWLINNNSLTMKANPLSLGSICSPVWLLILEPHSPLPVSPNFASVCSSGVCQGGWLGAGITGGVTDSWSLLSGPTIGTLRNFRR